MRTVNLLIIKIALISIIGQCIVPGNASAQQFYFNGSRKKQAINFTLIRNLVIIPLYINEKGPYNFILDTGVGPMVITDTSFVHDLNLQNLRPVKISGLGKGLEIDAFLSNDIFAEVGKAYIQNMPAAILKEDILGLSNYVGVKIYGLLGYYFFNSFIVEMKYSTKRLIFSLPGTKRKIKGESIPIKLINNKPYINITIRIPELGNTTIKMVVDNGASHALSLETLHEKPFPVPAVSIAANLGIGLSGPISGSVARIPEVKIGRFTLKNVIASYPQYDDVAVKTLLLNRNGNLGADILSGFNVTFDYANEVMYLKKNQLFNKPFEHDMSGIEVYVEGDNPPHYMISRVEPNSPADKSGLQANDEILSINFVKTTSLTLNDITRILRSGDDKFLFLSINRKGDLLIRTITLKKRI